MPTTAIAYEEDGWIISAETNYQGFTYDVKSNVCIPTNKRAKAKWLTLEMFYPDLVCGKTVIDLGANFGFLCFKALQHGALWAAAVESSPSYANPMKALCARFEPRIAWHNKRFANQTGGLKADVVICLSLLHHIFPKNSLEEVLEALQHMAGEAVVLEWISPEDRAIVRKGWGPDHPEYNQERFVSLCSNFFDSVVPMGQGHHKTRTIYLLKKG